MIQFLSYILDEQTPTYGNRNRFEIERKSDMARGDVANDSWIATTVHIGTHIDMPFHFHHNGSTIEAFPASYWFFEDILCVECIPDAALVHKELIQALKVHEGKRVEMLLVKTGACYARDEERYWSENYGFHPDIYDYLRQAFPDLRVMGFDSISVSSFTDRMMGREAHRRFLTPDAPILLLEDMDLRHVSETTHFRSLTVAPLRIAQCDGLPCTVMGDIG